MPSGYFLFFTTNEKISNVVEIQIEEIQVERAKKLYSFGSLNGSITKGLSNLYGAVGEIMVFDYLKNKHEIIFDSTYDYDMIVSGRKVDVKTKKTTVTPQLNYLCGIPAFNITQKCDYYFFCRVKEDFKTGFLLGYISKLDFFKMAVFKKKGELDINGFAFKGDCYNLEVSQLNNFKTHG